MINVILAEDHVLVRKAIRSLFDHESDIKITGEADNIEQLEKLLKDKVEADIIITELTMLGVDPLAFIKKTKISDPGKKVVFLSMHDNEKDIISSITAGAKGFLSKNTDITELLFAVRHIYNNGQYICTTSTQALVDRIKQIPEASSIAIDSSLEFSSREIEILTLMAQGFTNYEISERLFTSQRTVETHRQNLLNKTGSRNTAVLIKVALQHGLIS